MTHFTEGDETITTDEHGGLVGSTGKYRPNTEYPAIALDSFERFQVFTSGDTLHQPKAFMGTRYSIVWFLSNLYEAHDIANPRTAGMNIVQTEAYVSAGFPKAALPDRLQEGGSSSP